MMMMMMMMMMVKPWNNIDSATINKEPELDELNISDVIKQNIELSSDILICLGIKWLQVH